MANQDDKYHRQAQLDVWEHLLGYDVVDIDGGKIGTVRALWEDYTRQPAYLGVATSWLDLGRIHVVPAQYATLSEKRRCLRLPFPATVVKDAPQCHATDEITLSGETKIRDYYRKKGAGGLADAQAGEAMSRRIREDAPSRSPDWRARPEEDEDENADDRSFRDRIRHDVDERKSRVERSREPARDEVRDEPLGRPEREMGLPFEEPDEKPLRKIYRETPVAEPVLPREESRPRGQRDDPDDFVPLRKESLKSEHRRRDADRDDLPLR
jgi:hypothetical protein